MTPECGKKHTMEEKTSRMQENFHAYSTRQPPAANRIYQQTSDYICGHMTAALHSLADMVDKLHNGIYVAGQPCKKS